MKSKFKILTFEDRVEVVDALGDLVKVFLVRESDGKYARCVAFDRACCYVERLYSMDPKW